MRCKNCGSEVPEGSAFCYVCGEKVEEVVISSDIQDESNHNKIRFNPFENNSFNKIKKSTFNLSKSAAGFVENTGSFISKSFQIDEGVVFEKYDYDVALDYLHTNLKTKIAFPASDEKTKDKLNQLFSGEVIGTGAGLVGAAASIGLIGSTLGAGLIIIGAGALIGGVLNSHYEKMMWVPTDLFIKDGELIISGKFSIHYDEIKHVSTKIIEENEIVVLTLKDQAIEFKTYNAKALKTVIDEKL